MGTLPKQSSERPIKVQETLLERGLTIFSNAEFKRLFNTTPNQTKTFLEDYTKRGLLKRLKRGLYSLQIQPPSEEEIANALLRPSYISFEYALAYHNVLPEMVYTVTSATTKDTRQFVIEDKTFSYYTIKKEAYTGYEAVQKGERQKILIAEPEKALADYLYFVSLKKKADNDRLRLTHLDRKKVSEYAALFQRPALTELVKQL
jgi:predicted transcriptional regulator of viral defense system